MKFVIGIDSGATKTKLKIVLLDSKDSIFKIGDSGNINSAPIEQIKKTIQNLILDAISENHLDIKNCLGVCIGSAGADREREKNIYTQFINEIGIYKNVLIVSDAKIALESATNNKNRILMISGTGSICYGESEEGNSYRAGGWGHIIGDYGSGYYIGQKALSYVAEIFDNNAKKTILYNKILNHFNTDNPFDLIKLIYSSENFKKEVASLSVIVNEAYLENDEIAKKILEDASIELFKILKPIIKNIGKERSIDIAYTGSVILKCTFLQNNLNSLVIENFKNANILQKETDAVEGAIKLVLSYI